MLNDQFKRFTSSGAAQRLTPVYQLSLIYIVVGFLLRVTLWWQFGRASDVSAVNLSWILPAGILNDFIQSLLLSLPLAIVILFSPDRWYRTRTMRVVVSAVFVITVASLAFISAVEFFFFQEFDARLNLVAVDYLMYPTEVIGDIQAEYPLGLIGALSLAIGVGAYWLARPRLLKSSLLEVRWRERLRPVVIHALIATLAVSVLATDSFSFSNNRVANELVANGISSFFRAARTSELPYTTYYSTRDSQKNFALLTEFLASRGGKLTRLDEGRLTRHFDADANGLGKLNVVVVVEEAFGAEFSKLHGSELNLTPRFDAYAQQSLWFRNMYASGTRTVRGLEAISASFPPIPSVSILRRPNNERIATWGSVMQAHGYDSSFIYGGYGYFDNMNYFFANNGFDVQDRTSIKKKVRFENIWGVSDEDLFDRALDYLDERNSSGKPFFSLIMTTSNHKPFTFREGVPDVPASGGGRPAGVRYADFALGYFLDEAKKHAWFDNTVFVVVADHGARVYGKAEIPLRTYEIPMLIYSPKHVEPRTIETLASQIDIAPTVLGMLGLEYDAPFFGTNLLKCGSCAELALFSHNYDVAAYRGGRMAVLGLGKREMTLEYDRAADRYRSVEPDRSLTDLTIAIYQTAYEQFKAHKYE